MYRLYHRILLLAAVLLAVFLICSCGKTEADKGGKQGGESAAAAAPNAEEFEFERDPQKMCGDALYWTVRDGKLLIAGTGDMDDYDGSDREPPWTDLEYNAFHEILIQDGVTSVGNGAFASGEYFIDRLYLPEGLKRIGDWAFSDECEVRELLIPASVTQIGEHAFNPLCERCVVAQGNRFYTSDEYGALYNKAMTRLILFPCKSDIKAYTVPDGVTEISEDCFAWSALEKVTLPDSVAEIHANAFYRCEKLKEIRFPERLQKIGERAFAGCGFSEITLPDSVYSVGEHAFSGCESLTDVRFGPNLRELGEGAVSNCDALTELTLPEGLEQLPERAFNNSAISVLTLPSTLRQIGEYAFPGTLKLIYYHGTNERWGSIEGVDRYDAGENGLYNTIVTQSGPNNGLAFIVFGCHKTGYAAAEGGAELYAEREASEPLATVEKDRELYVCWTRGAWAFVDYNGGEARGWCRLSDLSIGSPRDGFYNAAVTAYEEKSVPLRASPDKSSAAVAELRDAASVEVLGEEGDWFRVKEPVSGKEGYLPRENTLIGYDVTNAYFNEKRTAARQALYSVIVQLSRSVDTKPSGGRSSVSDGEIVELLKEAGRVYARTPFGITAAEGPRYCDNGGYWFVDVTEFASAQDAYEYYISYYTDRAAQKIMMDWYILLDGEFCVLRGDTGGDGPAPTLSVSEITRYENGSVSFRLREESDGHWQEHGCGFSLERGVYVLDEPFYYIGQ